ncbi:uncharacterized protein TNCV_4247171 [Trichonephila clavipes]|nr:uncharacterized protein TNCV_4247171 [Trichonephila clavipes]
MHVKHVEVKTSSRWQRVVVGRGVPSQSIQPSHALQALYATFLIPLFIIYGQLRVLQSFIVLDALPLERMKIAKAEFEAMVLEGTARRGKGSWASQLHLVPNKSESWHPCGDYRALNARTIPNSYLIRHIHDYSHRL